MSIHSSNFYEVLGIDRASDERTVKKAYFTLVRKYPPETHPEEFKKLREAYEVLSDAESRKQYDAMGGLGGAADEQVQLALKAMDETRYADAQVLLAKLLNQRPELHFARDMLGMAYLHDKKPEVAQEVFDELVRSHPNNAAYHLHRAYSLHAQQKLDNALEAYGRARALDREDVRALVGQADCFMEQKRWNDAVRTLDEAINLDGAVDFKDFALFTRKLEVEIERRDAAAVQRVLAQLMPIVPEEPAARRFVANRLASLAAPLFAMKRTQEANLLMAECAKLDPTRGSGAMPASFTVDIDALPEASKQWLAEQKKAKSPTKVNNSAYAGPVVLGLLGAGAVGFFLLALYGDDKPIAGPAFVTMWTMMATFGVLGAWAVRRFRAAWRSPYGAYTVVHPLYLLQVKVDQLTAWPLANLHDVHVTHHSTNGVYTTSAIKLVFDKRTFNLNIYGQQASVDWANTVLAHRRRMLELMYSGLLEESSEDMQLIPAAVIPAAGAKKEKRPEKAAADKRWLVAYAATAGVLGALTIAAVPLNARRADDREFRNAQFAYDHKVRAYKDYLAHRPDGRHVAEAKAGIVKLYDDALARVKAHQQSELAPALIDIVEALKAKDATAVRVTYASKTLFEKFDLSKLPPALAKGLVDPRGAFTPERNRAREYEISRSLEQAFDELLGRGLVEVESGGREASPVTLEVGYEVGLTGSIYESVKPTAAAYGAAVPSTNDDKKFLGIGFLWTFDVRLEGDEKPRYTFDLDSEPAKNIRWTSFGSRYGAAYESPTLPYDKMAESAFDDFKNQLGVKLGVAKPSQDRLDRLRDRLADEGAGDEPSDDEAPAPPPRRPAPKPKKPAKPARP